MLLKTIWKFSSFKLLRWKTNYPTTYNSNESNINSDAKVKWVLKNQLKHQFLKNSAKFPQYSQLNLKKRWFNIQLTNKPSKEKSVKASPVHTKTTDKPLFIPQSTPFLRTRKADFHFWFQKRYSNRDQTNTA